MSTKKRIIALSLVVLTGLLLMWLAISLVADYRYREVTSNSISSIESAIVNNDTYSFSALSRQDGCGRGVFKGSAGAKVCSTSITISTANLTRGRSQILFTEMTEIIKENAKIYHEKNSNIQLEREDDQATGTDGSYSFNLVERRNFISYQCVASAHYETIAAKAGKPYMDEDSLGDLEIRLSCDTTDWWTRNVVNRLP